MKWTDPHDIISGGRGTDTDTVTFTVSEDYDNYPYIVPHEDYFGETTLEDYLQASNDREEKLQADKESREDLAILLKVLQQLDDDNEIKKMFNAEKAAKILRGE